MTENIPKEQKNVVVNNNNSNQSEQKTNWGDEPDPQDEKLAAELNDKATLTKAAEEDDLLPLKNLGLRPGQDKAELQIEQTDPNSPLYSAQTWEELKLRPELLKGVYEMKFLRPSRIQEHAIPNIIADPPKNFIGQAQSGTGKTAAFALSILSRADPTLKFTQALCCAPTRELVRQIAEVIKKLARFTEFKCTLVVKDASLPKKITDQIVVGTPGKLLDVIKRRQLDLGKVKIFVLDEADVMLDRQGLADQSLRIKRQLPPTCQILLFSATYRDDVREFAEKVVPHPKITIRLKPEELTLDKIDQYFIKCTSEAHKFQVLSEIYKHLPVGSSIVFVQTRKAAQELTERMRKEGHEVSLLHGNDMPSEVRDKIIDDFRENRTRVLITTNVLARGIDILQVSLVVNFDLPVTVDHKPDPETYLHRIGRSGRFGRRGIAINLIHDKKSQEILKTIESFFKKPIKEFPIEQIENLSTMKF
jgi:ATP-dependent RNA helicase DDX19/DBP5